MKGNTLRILAGAVIAAVGLTAHTAFAADYPEKPVRLIVPTAAGGSLDTIARLLGQRLEATLGKPFVVENRAGANGNTAFEFVAKAKPDGYTLLVASDALAINPSLYQNVNYDPVKSYAPVALVTTAAQVLVVNPALGVKDLKGFTAVAKQKGKGLSIGSPGSGSAGHLSAVLYQAETKTEWTHVAFKGGGPAVTNVVGGHIDGLFVTLAPAVPQIKAGKLVALAVTTPKRAVALPDVPAVGESLPGFDVTNWQGVFAPAGTPAAVVNKLNATIQKIVAEPEIQSKLVDLGFETAAGAPAELGKQVQENFAKWAKIIPQANITVD